MITKRLLLQETVPRKKLHTYGLGLSRLDNTSGFKMAVRHLGWTRGAAVSISYDMGIHCWGNDPSPLKRHEALLALAFGRAPAISNHIAWLYRG